MAPMILIFSTAMGAKPSFYMKLIATYAPAFFGYNNPVLARVIPEGREKWPPEVAIYASA